MMGVVVVTFTVHGSGLSQSLVIIMTLVVVDAGNTVLGSSKLVVVRPHSSSSSSVPLTLSLYRELSPHSGSSSSPPLSASTTTAATTATGAPSGCSAGITVLLVPSRSSSSSFGIVCSGRVVRETVAVIGSSTTTPEWSFSEG